jgi:acetyltransferase
VERDGHETQLGVARYFTNPDGRTAEFALAIADGWQRRGLGTRLMACLIEAAREKGFAYLQGDVLANNVKMLALVKRMGFQCRINEDDPTLVVVVKEL